MQTLQERTYNNGDRVKTKDEIFTVSEDYGHSVWVYLENDLSYQMIPKSSIVAAFTNNTAQSQPQQQEQGFDILGTAWGGLCEAGKIATAIAPSVVQGFVVGEIFRTVAKLGGVYKD